MLGSIEKLLKKLKEDTAGDFVFMTCPEQHGFRAGTTIESYVVIANAIKREVSERCILLPLDADHVPIHIGDMMTDGVRKFEVFGLTAFGNGLWIVRNKDGDTWAACDLTHYHEPTVEDVLRDMLCAWEGTLTSEGVDGIIAEYAKRLRLASDGE